MRSPRAQAPSKANAQEGRPSLEATRSFSRIAPGNVSLWSLYTFGDDQVTLLS